jgi:hypothetical protein
VRAELRFEVFNLFDNLQLYAVDATMNPPLDSIVYDAPLESATRVLSYRTSPTFGQATRARDPRQAQFGVKLLF